MSKRLPPGNQKRRTQAFGHRNLLLICNNRSNFGSARQKTLQCRNTPNCLPMPMLNRLFNLPLVALLWLLHLLPLSVLSIFGRGFGMMLYTLSRHRRKVATLNIDWCFPELDAYQRKQLVQDHFKAIGRSLLERSVLWWGSEARLRQMIRLEGEDILRAHQQAGKPVILLAPHFVGLDAGGIAIALRFDSVSLYAAQSSATFDRLLLKGRSRFGDQLLLSRQDGIRASLKAMRAGRPFYYLPDISGRSRDSVFVPFFGIQTATISATSRLAHAAGAVILPCVTRMLPGGQGYQVEIGQALEGIPSTDVVADTAQINAWIESVVRTMPEQYYWVHRRFKKRPPGEARPY